MEGGGGTGGGGRSTVAVIALLILLTGALTLQTLRRGRSSPGTVSSTRTLANPPPAAAVPAPAPQPPTVQSPAPPPPPQQQQQQQQGARASPPPSQDAKEAAPRAATADTSPAARPPPARPAPGELPPFGRNCSHPLAFVFSGECSGHRYLVDTEIYAEQIPKKPSHRPGQRNKARANPKLQRYFRGDHIPGIGHVTASFNAGFKLAVLLGLTYVSVMPIAYGHKIGIHLTAQFGMHSLLSAVRAQIPPGLRKVPLPQDTVGLSKEQNGTQKLWLIPSDADRYRPAAAAVAAGPPRSVVFELGARTKGTAFAPDTVVDGEYGLTRWLVRGAFWRANGERLRANSALCGGQRARVVVHWRSPGAFDNVGFVAQRELASEWLGRVVSLVLADMRTAGDLRPVDVVIHHQAGNKRLAELVACPASANCSISVSTASTVDFLDDVATADVLVASRSGLSQIAALLGKRGQVVVHAPFWHSYEFAVAVATGCVRVYGSHLKRAAGVSFSINDTMGDPPYDSAQFADLYRRRFSITPADSPCALEVWCSPGFASWPAPPALGRLCEARRRLADHGSEGHYACG
eukprot:TRINITY_DN15675_c0_g1_i3.p1 TRINITY_DN15675_c0_g1~~TRINITY_DN15675_c0_g1_i3.p1  ORF type:complete len:606 (+),score=114.99 TRINITY_DN15675_c0_g1_i3:89-1819(+)